MFSRIYISLIPNQSNTPCETRVCSAAVALFTDAATTLRSVVNLMRLRVKKSQIVWTFSRYCFIVMLLNGGHFGYPRCSHKPLFRWLPARRNYSMPEHVGTPKPSASAPQTLELCRIRCKLLFSTNIVMENEYAITCHAESYDFTYVCSVCMKNMGYVSRQI